jgi:hypothetical protein
MLTALLKDCMTQERSDDASSSQSVGSMKRAAEPIETSDEGVPDSADDEDDAESSQMDLPGLDNTNVPLDVISASRESSVYAEDVAEAPRPHVALTGILPANKHDLKQLASSGQAGRILYIFEKISGVQIDLAKEDD